MLYYATWTFCYFLHLIGLLYLNDLNCPTVKRDLKFYFLC